MKLHIGIELTDYNFCNVDLSKVENGNPGVGGSEYLFALLALSLKKYAANKMEVTVYHYSSNKLPDDIEDVIVGDCFELLRQAENHVDILIYQVAKNKNWYIELSDKNLQTVAWGHCYIGYDEMQWIKHCDKVKRVVCVGKEEYDSYIDDDIIQKCCWIYNMMNTKGNHIMRSSDYDKSVTYVGSLVPQKGFHVLARVWPEILKKVPDAKLNVIGTGRLYDRNAQLGKYHIAQSDYEDEFMPYLTDSQGEILSSVTFWGVLGEEKESVFAKTAVGVVNPTASGETFCLSAIEMELCGVPVVSKKAKGLLDTIKCGNTGYLFNTDKEFIDYVVELLKDKDKNMIMGKQGNSFVLNNFEIEIVIQKWIKVLQSISKNDISVYERPSANYRNDYKWIRMIIRFFRVNLHWKSFPSLSDIQQFVRKVKGKIQ